MGDVGSLALGGVLAGLAIVSRTELLLPVLGGLFVIITLSVAIQVSVFKVSKLKTGRRGRSGCSGWRRCSITLNRSAGRKPRSWCGSG